MIDGELTPPPADTRVPSWVREILTRGLSPRPSARWPSVLELLEALRRGAQLRRVAVTRLPRPRYAESDGVHLAYVTVGSGALDVVLINGWIASMRAMFEHERMTETVGTLSQLGRLVLFDKRGTGLSDRVQALPTYAQRVDDLRAVLDAVGARDALLVGVSEGAGLALLFANAYPERTRGLAICGGFARMTEAPDYPWGYSEAELQRLRRYIRNRWGDGGSMRALCPSRLSEPAYVDWISAIEREGASPGGALELLEMNAALDLRPELAKVTVPTTVLFASEDKMTHPAAGAFLAREIPGARHVVVEGDDHTLLFDHHDVLLRELERLAALGRS
ncbi:MAG: alpha/beta fold hydrolase [Myxococcales bacterium]|nr:alpha/beta fold hydrolase [Myxococcales bacterium]